MKKFTHRDFIIHCARLAHEKGLTVPLLKKENFTNERAYYRALEVIEGGIR